MVIPINKRQFDRDSKVEVLETRMHGTRLIQVTWLRSEWSWSNSPLGELDVEHQTWFDRSDSPLGVFGRGLSDPPDGELVDIGLVATSFESRLFCETKRSF